MKALHATYPTWFTADAKTQYGAGNVDAWLLDSMKLRYGVVYPDDDQIKNFPGEEYKHRAYCRWLDEEHTGATTDTRKKSDLVPAIVNRGYTDRFTVGPNAAVPTQLIKAGLRLATLLDSIAAAATAERNPVQPSK